MIETRQVDFHMDKIIQPQLDKIRYKVMKKDEDWVCVVDGEEGCLTGDTLINCNRKDLGRTYDLKWMYNQYHKNPDKLKHFKQWDLTIPTRVRSFNGDEIRLHKINNVVYSGKKKVFEIILEDGKKIKATEEHKFLTQKGWKEVKELIIEEDKLMCDKLNSSKFLRKRIKLYDIQLRVDYHPSGKRVEVHRLIYEAHLNNLHFLDFLDILLNEKEKSKELKYIDSDKYHVHHKDGNHYNNDLKNLELIDKQDHLVLHGKDNYKNFSQSTPYFSKVLSIKEIGIEDTYDIQCSEPYHNFVANGIVAHNSGKSVFAMQLAKYLDPNFNVDNVCFDSDDFMNRLKNAPKFSAIVLDEAYQSANSRSAMTEVNKSLVGVATEMRQNNLFVIIVLPTFFDLDKYFAIWRCKTLFHVYKDKKTGDRGKYVIFPKNSKKMLYLYGKKFYNYNKPSSPYPPCRFPKHYVIDETEYRLKKSKAFKKEKITNQARKWRTQRDAYIKELYHKAGYSTKNIGLLLDDWNAFKLSQRVIQDIVQLDMKKGDLEGE